MAIFDLSDCCFERGNGWFRYRVGAIIIENGSLLVVKTDTVDYHYSVGGGVHIGELSEQAVVREVKEETGVEYEVDRLAFVHENIYRNSILHGDMVCHEIAFFYLMKPRGTQELHSHSINVYGEEHMVWVPLDKIAETKIYPKFFAEKLTELLPQLQHIVTKDA